MSHKSNWFAIGIGSAAILVAAATFGAELGSSDFKPTPDHPVGWRGDWTGRFPGATPPTQWSRRVKGSTTEMKYQAKKPIGEPGADARSLEYFTIKDWLTIGPFDAADPVKDIDKDFLGGEATIQPNEGDKVGETSWRPQRISMETQVSQFQTCKDLFVDFIYLYGKPFAKVEQGTVVVKIEGSFSNKVAYAHTYIHSPSSVPAVLRIPFLGAACKVWLNGQPVALPKDNGREIQVDVAKGWNRFLIKISTAGGIKAVGQAPNWASDWSCAAYLAPAMPVSYETRNIAWMTRMTGRSVSSPITVGDHVFVGSSISDLMCINKTDGKILWIRTSTPWDALNSEEKKQHEGTVGPMIVQLERLNNETVRAINDMVSPRGMTSPQETELDKKLKVKFDLEKKIHDAFKTLDSKRFPPLYNNEVSPSNATPTSDGNHVYWACGGGIKGCGAVMVVCYDLDGKRLWSCLDNYGTPEHGTHISPVLVDGKLIYGIRNTLEAFNIADGTILWKQTTGEFCSVSPQGIRIGSVNAILVPSMPNPWHPFEVFRASDGVKLAVSSRLNWGTHIVEKDMAYFLDKWPISHPSFVAFRLPDKSAAGGEISQAWELPFEDVHLPLRGAPGHIASPICVDGILYAVSTCGGLIAVDLNTRKSVYRRMLEWYNRFDRYLFGVTVSPALGGKNIYLFDDAGSSIILEPGREYKEVGRNIIENIHSSGSGRNPCRQELFYSNPWFEGNSIYLKGEEYLYCIQEQKRQ